MHIRNCCKLYFITRQYVGKTHLSSVYRVLHLLRPIGVYLVVEELSYFYPLVLWILVTVPLAQPTKLSSASQNGGEEWVLFSVEGCHVMI